MTIHIKICGFTTVDGVKAAVEAGVDSVGFVLDPSPRQLTIEQANALAAHVPDSIQTVAVCGRPSVAEVQEIWEHMRPDWIQLMSDAHPGHAAGLPIIPAFEDGADLVDRVSAYVAGITDPDPLILADGPKPGSGIVADWDRVRGIARTHRLMIAGGLTPENVGTAIERLGPWAVDVSSGVEQSPGVKSPEKIRAFVEAVRRAERSVETKNED